MLRRYLPSVLKHSGGARIIVADNASTDDSVALLRAEFPQVEVVLLTQNWGFADGYNKALTQIEADRYVLLNSDVEVTEGWLHHLEAFMDSHPEVAAVQPKLRKATAIPQEQTEKPMFEYAGAAGGMLDMLGYPYCRGRIFGDVEPDNGQYDTPMQIHWATGACLMINAKDYWNAGGLDGRFFAHNEEIDLCWRLRLQGRQIWCQPSSVVYHLGGGTLPQGNPRKTYLNFRNNLLMLYKNLPQADLSRVMRWRWVLDRVAAMQSLLLQGNWQDCKAILRARRDFCKMKSEYASIRQDIQSNRIDNGPDRNSCSILWQYYIKGKRTFSQL